MITNITVNSIEKTLVYNKLDGFQKKIIASKVNRKSLEEALINYNKTGYLPKDIGSINTLLLNELINSSNDKNLQHKENNIKSQKIFEENKKEFSNQCRIIFEAFKRGERLTTSSALLNYGIGDLRRRVKDLKDICNVPVQSEIKEKKFKEYYLNN